MDTNVIEGEGGGDAASVSRECEQPEVIRPRRSSSYGLSACWQKWCRFRSPGLGLCILTIFGIFLLFIYLPDHFMKEYTVG